MPPLWTSAQVPSPTHSHQSKAASLRFPHPATNACCLGVCIDLNQTVVVQNLHGTLAAPYRISAAPGADVLFDGTLDVPTSWQQVAASGATGSHWVANWPVGYPEPYQLFIDGEMMIPARWPNARWDNKTVFDDLYWAHGSRNSTYCGSELRDVEYAGPCRLVDGTTDPTPGGSRSLAISGINATGAAAILNIGHWFSFAGMVLEHAPGRSDFIYERDAGGGGWKAAKYKPTADLYYLEGALSLLDAETEWTYEQSTRTIHLKTIGDVNPSSLGLVTARVQDYAIAITDCSYLIVSNMRFFASTVYAAGETNNADLHNVRLDSLRFVHPSATKRLLGDCKFSHPTTLARKRGNTASNNTLFNCSFFGAEGHPLINSAGSGMVFDNNLIEWTDWSAVTTRPVAYFDETIENGMFGRYGSGAMTLEVDRSTLLEAPNFVRRNTIHHSGPSVGLAITADNVHSELNHVSYQYAIQEDGGLMQMNGLKVDEDPEWGLTNKHNWLHDALVERSTKWGLRFDRVNQECYGNVPSNGGNTWAYHGSMEANVVWNCNGLMIKGNNHTITRNTVFDTSPLNFESDGQPRDIAVYSYHDFGTCQCTDTHCIADNETCCVAGDSNTYENINSIFLGNGMDGFLALVGGSTSAPSTAEVDSRFAVMRSENNSAGALFEQLRDPHNWDFRPRPGSVWAEKSIGAYDAVGDRGHYWIPGHIEWRASMPIPPDGSSNVQPDADLMFLGGSGSGGRHRVMAGLNPSALTEVAILNGDENIATPPVGLLGPLAIVHWRIDMQPDGDTSLEWLEGPVWSFTVAPLPPPPSPPFPPPPPCATITSSSSPQYVYEPGGAMAWMSLGNVLTNYPPEWMITSFTVCVDAYHTAGLGNAVTLRIKEFTSNAVSIFFMRRGGSATNMTSACFADGASAGAFPNDASGQPFTGTWAPQASLQPLVDAGVGGQSARRCALAWASAIRHRSSTHTERSFASRWRYAMRHHRRQRRLQVHRFLHHLRHRRRLLPLLRHPHRRRPLLRHQRLRRPSHRRPRRRRHRHHHFALRPIQMSTTKRSRQ